MPDRERPEASRECGSREGTTSHLRDRFYGTLNRTVVYLFVSYRKNVLDTSCHEGITKMMRQEFGAIITYDIAD